MPDAFSHIDSEGEETEKEKKERRNKICFTAFKNIYVA